jgi:peroxiredoxin
MDMRFAGVLVAAALSLFASGELSNRRAPGFALPDSNYQHSYDLQDYRGKVLLIDFMQTSCSHCMLFTTTLENLKAKYGDRVGILSVVMPPDNPTTVLQYISKNKVTVPIVFDQGQMAISYFNAKPGQGHIDVPHLFIIDKNGMIRNDFQYSEADKAVFEGPRLFQEVDKLLK